MPGIKDIARLAGVSPATVSRVVNNREYVKEEIRNRVLAVVRETGYVPNHAARSMVLKRTFSVGIVIPGSFNMFQRQLFSIIERHLESRGFQTIFFFVTWERESEADCLDRIKSRKLDGLIMLHELRDLAFYEYLAHSSLPSILVTSEHPGFPSIHIDESEAAFAATEHLIALGHRHIGLLAGAHFSFSEKRREGFMRALDRHGLKIEARNSVTVPAYSPEAGRMGMERILQAGGRPGAIFAMTDELAIGAMRALHEAGLRVPQDVSVIGIDDIDISAFTVPALSTVRQPILDMGTATARFMASLIAGETAMEEATIYPFTLVTRESTAAPG